MRLVLAATTLAAVPFLFSVAAAPAESNLPMRAGTKLQTLFSNLASHYPYGMYIAHENYSVYGPTFQGTGPQNWLAAAFLSPANTSVVRITVAAAWVSGTNSVVLSLRSDNSGIPGTVLHKWTLSNLPGAGACCIVQIANSKGIPVQFMQRYWVVLSTDSADANFGGGWHYNDTDQVHSAQLAYNAGGGWIPFTSTPAPAFAVYGSP